MIRNLKISQDRTLRFGGEDNLTVNNGQTRCRDVNGCVFNFFGVGHSKHGRLNMDLDSVRVVIVTPLILGFIDGLMSSWITKLSY
jgi:hypothetical protein